MLTSMALCRRFDSDFGSLALSHIYASGSPKVAYPLRFAAIFNFSEHDAGTNSRGQHLDRAMKKKPSPNLS